MILKLGMKHQGMHGALKIYINHDPGMTYGRPILWQGQLRPPMHLNGENC